MERSNLKAVKEDSPENHTYEYVEAHHLPTLPPSEKQHSQQEGDVQQSQKSDQEEHGEKKEGLMTKIKEFFTGGGGGEGKEDTSSQRETLTHPDMTETGTKSNIRMFPSESATHVKGDDEGRESSTTTETGKTKTGTSTTTFEKAS